MNIFFWALGSFVAYLLFLFVGAFLLGTLIQRMPIGFVEVSSGFAGRVVRVTHYKKRQRFVSFVARAYRICSLPLLAVIFLEACIACCFLPWISKRWAFFAEEFFEIQFMMYDGLHEVALLPSSCPVLEPIPIKYLLCATRERRSLRDVCDAPFLC